MKKICTKCHLEREIDLFSLKRNGTHYAYCNACRGLCDTNHVTKLNMVNLRKLVFILTEQLRDLHLRVATLEHLDKTGATYRPVKDVPASFVPARVLLRKNLPEEQAREFFKLSYFAGMTEEEMSIVRRRTAYLMLLSRHLGKIYYKEYNRASPRVKRWKGENELAKGGSSFSSVFPPSYSTHVQGYLATRPIDYKLILQIPGQV